MESISGRDFEKHGIPEPDMDCAEYINQEDDYGDSMRGEWYVVNDERSIIYGGTFGNDHSPGAMDYTWAEVYDADEGDDFNRRAKELEACPEYVERDEELDEDDESEDE